MTLKAEDGRRDEPEGRRPILSSHPRLGILIIAGIFYLLLCGMVVIVLALIVSGAF